jgi:hypothetical protein
VSSTGSNDDPWLAAGEDAGTALLPLAEALFRQMLNLGRLSSAWPPDERTTERLMPRIGVTLALLELLTVTSQLRFARAGLAYVSNTQHWSEAAPGAGRTGTGPDPAPADVVHTLLAGWAAHCRGEYPIRRPLRAALQHTRDHGLVEGLLLLIELLRLGYVPAEAANVVIDVLLRARGRVADDGALVRTLAPGAAALVSARDWTEAELIDLPEDDRTVPDHLPELGALVNLAIEQPERLRVAASLDDWVLLNCDVATVLGAVLDVLERSRDRLPLGVRALLSQWEENRADSGGYTHMLRSQLSEGKTGSPEWLIGYGALIQAMAASHGGERMLRQRVVVPPGYLSLVTSGAPTPPEWRHLSIDLMPLATAYQQESCEFLSIATSSPAQATGSAPPVDADTFRTAFTQILQATEAGEYDRSVELCHRMLSTLPWSSILRHELAIALDLSGKPEEALEVLVQAIRLRPEEGGLWQSLRVVLNRCDRPAEARLAAVMQEFLAQRDAQMSEA